MRAGVRAEPSNPDTREADDIGTVISLTLGKLSI
jgi:hypothetical protein